MSRDDPGTCFFVKRIVHGRYLIAKADLIEYVIEHGDDERPGRFRTGSDER